MHNQQYPQACRGLRTIWHDTASAEHAPLAHFYPPLTRAPSPRGYGLRLVQHGLFYLLVFKMLNLGVLKAPSYEEADTRVLITDH